MSEERKLPSGETITIIKDGTLWCVECWDADGHSRWCKTFGTYDAALIEFNRW